MGKNVLWSVLLFFLPIFLWAQDHHLPQPMMQDTGTGGPPPPGLVVPIDTNISLLAAAGLLLGVYYLKIKK